MVQSHADYRAKQSPQMNKMDGAAHVSSCSCVCLLPCKVDHAVIASKKMFFLPIQLCIIVELALGKIDAHFWRMAL